ncbi:hypothetical protein ATE48_07140 [Candidatus Viadribacter manganicus]|uniref:Uncharacterized protein n=2 Tax=Candidatus Viadribacter manganicus TaxID=1759059 RepID=A0A1B1AGM8_9PROT|nr:hypothetical protein ATE48_07140 [Candidatus Viadribacter manganicus]
MVCVLPPNGAFAFDVFPANAQNAGAQCSSTQDGVAVGWVAVRFSTPTTLDAVFSASVAQLAAGLEPEAWPGQVSAADLQSPQGLVHYRIQRLQAPVGGEMQFLRVAVAERDGWYLQQIVSAPIASAQEAETAAGEIWRQGLARFSAPNVSDAAAAG